MSHYVLDKHHFAKDNKLLRKTLYFCKFFHVSVSREKKTTHREKHESTRHLYQKGKIHSRYCNSPNIFCNVGKIKIPNRRIDRDF